MSENKTLKRKIFKAAAIFSCIAALIIAFLAGFFIRSLIVGRDAAALSEIAAYLKKYGVFDSETMELIDFSPEDAARLIIQNSPDKYATYYSEKEYESVKNSYSGKYRGVGISVFLNTLTIAKVTVNSPSFKVGVKAGDVLVSGVSADGKETVFTDIESVNSFLTAVNSDGFTLTVSRGGVPVSFSLNSENYDSSYLLYKDKDAAFAFLSDNGKKRELKTAGDGDVSLPENVAYIKFDSFEGGAADELKGMLALMRERGKTRLILDVRGNGGGYMDVLSDFAGGVIKCDGENKFVLAYSKDNKGEFTEYKSSGSFYYENLEKIAVIADELSASATECLIGAMLHYGGAFSADNLVIENEELIVGAAHTFGKGIMQTTFMLSNGGALKLTTAIIYQPDKSTCIHGAGISVNGENAVKKSDNKALERAVAILS